jgi:hypothetical protein
MNLRRKVAAIMLLAAAIGVGSETRRASAQDAPPDLRMLMNLDLFEPRPNKGANGAAAAASPTDDSMLDQIRTLDAMGYLGNHAGDGENGAPAPRAAVGSEPAAAGDVPDAPPAPAPASQPSDDVEGPQP